MSRVTPPSLKEPVIVFCRGGYVVNNQAPVLLTPDWIASGVPSNFVLSPRSTTTENMCRNMCDVPAIFVFLKTCRYILPNVLTAPFGVASPLIKRQVGLPGFFRFCYDAGVIPANPTAQLSSIQVKADEANNIRPFEPNVSLCCCSSSFERHTASTSALLICTPVSRL